jgi:uncharacterized protein YndB with AHSA1/START domain
VSTRSARPSGDQAIVSVVVRVDRDAAFDVFTTEIDLWWQHGLRFRPGGRRPGALSFEPGINGRLFETVEIRPGTPHTYEMGRVTAWEPPSRFVLEWRNTNFAPEESTEVEVLFESTHSGTRVTVHHRGWSVLRPGHPARHGLEGAAFSRMIGLWWSDLMTSFREFLETSRKN